MAVPIQLAAAAVLEAVPVRILVVVVAVVDILVADTVVVAVVVAGEVVPSHRIAVVDTAVAVVVAVGIRPVEIDSNHPGRRVWLYISPFLESEQYLRFRFGENESPCGPPERAESPVSPNFFGFPCRDSTLFLVCNIVNREKEIRVSAKRESRKRKRTTTLRRFISISIISILPSPLRRFVHSLSIQTKNFQLRRINKRTIIQYDRSVGLIDFR